MLERLFEIKENEYKDVYKVITNQREKLEITKDYNIYDVKKVLIENLFIY